MRSIPAEVLLSWPTPNYDDPVTRGYALVVVNSIFITLVVIVVSLRLYTRLWIKRWFGSDDLFIILALVFAIALTAVVLLANQQYGWDRHVYDIPFHKFTPTSKIAMAAKVVFTCAATFTRLSLLFFYYRLVSDTGKRWFVWGIHANVAFSVGIFISFVCLAIFQCNPIRNYWTFGAPAHTCLNEGTVTLCAGIINCIADLAVTILPIPMVMTLQMPKRQRIAVAILFSLGLIVTIAGIVRTWYIYKSLIAEYDLTWYAYPLWIAAAVEIDLGVICASAPVLRPLLAKIPFSLSVVSSRFSSSKFSSKTPSGAFPSKISDKNTSGTTLQGSANRSSNLKSVTSSKRRSEAIREETETQLREEDYELRQWDDVERGLRPSSASHGDSQDAILSSEDDNYHFDNKKRWKKRVTISDLTSRGITTTSEENLELDRISTRSSDAVGQNPRSSMCIIGEAR